MVAERLRQLTLLLGAITAAGLAEQHHYPADIIAEIPYATWPSKCINLWTVTFSVAAVMCLIAFIRWPRPNWMRVSAIVLSTSLIGRSVGVFTVYGFDLWGTVAGWFMTAALLIGSWSWSGSAIRSIREPE